MQHANSSREAIAITALLSGFPASETIDQGARFHAFRVAVDGIPVEAIEQAAAAFIKGKVKREDNRFAPSCAEFADRCRDEANMIAAQRRAKIEPPAPKPPAPRVNPEKMKLLLAMNNGSESARKKLREMGYRV